MMKFRIFMAALTVALISQVAYADQQLLSMKIEGMYCAACPYIVGTAIKAVPGVTSASVSDETKIAKVMFENGETGVQEIAEAVRKIGYAVKVLP